MKKIIISILLSIPICSCSYLSDNNTEIIIGGISPLTNQGTIFGKMMKNVAELRLSKINEEGGIQGKKIQITWRDGKCDKETATAAAKNLIYEEKVKIILGGVCSQETLGAGKIANEEKVFLLSPISTSPEISKLGDYVFRTMVPSSTQGRALGKYANKMKYQRAGILYDANDYTEPIKISFTKSFTGKDVFEEEISWAKENIKEQIRKFLTRNPDFLFINLQSPEIFLELMGILEEFDSNIPIITNQVGIDGLSALKGSPYIKKIKPLGAAFYVNVESPRFLTFEKEYEERYGIPLEYKHFAGTTLDAIDTLVEVMKRVNNPQKPNQIKEGFQKIQHPGFSGPVIFDSNGDIRGRNSLVTYDGEKFQVIEKESY